MGSVVMRSVDLKPAALILAAICASIILTSGAAAQHVTAAGRDRAMMADVAIEKPVSPDAGAVSADKPFRAYNDLIKMRSKCRTEAQRFIQKIREEFPDANSEVRTAIEPLFRDALDKNNKFNEAIYNFIRGANRTDLRNQWIDAEFAYVTLMNSRTDSHGRRNVCKNCITVIYPLASAYWCAITKLEQRKQLAEEFIAGVKWD
jgi:hypothetical protein